jgi:dUTP pyrophosphatase
LPGPPLIRNPLGMDLPFKRLDPGAPLPSSAHPGDAGVDLRSNIDCVIEPGERLMVPTGLAVAIPEGHAGLVLPRSGLASRRGLTLANSPGLIDAGYRGEIICAVVNLDRTEPVKIARGDRIAQLVIVPIAAVEPVWVDELPVSERGEGGFGSTGR